MSNSMAQAGKVYLVGAGPGDPELITVKAMRLIETADVLVYDALANPLLLTYASSDAELIDAGKRAGKARLKQEETNALLAEKAMAGHMVVRLKGGDPYVFGRGSEEAIYLHERGIETEIVPGITAGIAAPAYAGIPVTHRRVATTCTFVTGHEDPAKVESQVDFLALAQLARNGGTLCFYMGMERLPTIVEQLIRHGLRPDTPAAVIQWGTRSSQRSVIAPLDAIHETAAEAGLGAPAIVLIGQVAGLDREALCWFERRPLFGQTIVVTRTRQQASQLRLQLEQLGAQVIEAPTIEVVDPDDWQPIVDAITDIARYDWLVLTSPNGVIGLGVIMESLGMDGRDLAQLKIATIGQTTADVLRHVIGVNADLIPEEYVAEALAKDMAAVDTVDGRRVLLLRADIARATLPDQLTAAGALVEDVAIYRTRRAESLPDELLDALRLGKVNWLTFTSSSTVRNFVELLGEERQLIDGLSIASIGPITSATVREFGLTVTTEAVDHDIDGLIAALQQAIGAGTKANSPDAD